MLSEPIAIDPLALALLMSWYLFVLFWVYRIGVMHGIEKIRQMMEDQYAE